MADVVFEGALSSAQHIMETVIKDASTSNELLHEGAVRYPLHYRDVMVHLDGGDEDEIRIAHAEMIATIADGHLTGLFTNPIPDIAIYASEQGTMAAAEITDLVREQGRTIHARLKKRFERLGVSHDVRIVEDISGFLPKLAATEARCADLFVASCPYHAEPLHHWDRMIETVMFEAGHGLYLVPRGLKPRNEIRTVKVGWVDTREAARAIAEALPLLRLASKVELVTIHEPRKGRTSEAIGMTDIATHLDRHGVETTVTVVPPKEDVATALLEQAHRISADVIVAGAYGHSRLREWILGGATQDLIRYADLPLLMAH